MIASSSGIAFAIMLAGPATPETKVTANPELVGALAQKLGSTPQQAEVRQDSVRDEVRRRGSRPAPGRRADLSGVIQDA